MQQLWDPRPIYLLIALSLPCNNKSDSNNDDKKEHHHHHHHQQEEEEEQQQTTTVILSYGRSGFSSGCLATARRTAGDFYFHSVIVMVFLVNIISLCAFSIPLHDVSGRLGHLSTSFLAVLAYRYVIDDTLPRKEYLTASDLYIIFACSFQVVICIETVVLGLLVSHVEVEDLDSMKQYRLTDHGFGLVLLVVWLATNLCLRWLWKSGGRMESWQQVYQNNKEPYAPVEDRVVCRKGPSFNSLMSHSNMLQ